MDDPKFNNFLIKEYKYWKVYIHQDQTLLGRSYLWSKREDAVDFLEMTEEEKAEFFETARILKNALVKLFNPDLLNYEALENETYHLHVHVLPRYKEKIVFAGITFRDSRFGGRYQKSLTPLIDGEVLQKIKDAIVKEIN